MRLLKALLLVFSICFMGCTHLGGTEFEINTKKCPENISKKACKKLRR